MHHQPRCKVWEKVGSMSYQKEKVTHQNSFEIELENQVSKHYSDDIQQEQDSESAETSQPIMMIEPNQSSVIQTETGLSSYQLTRDRQEEQSGHLLDMMKQIVTSIFKNMEHIHFYTVKN